MVRDVCVCVCVFFLQYPFSTASSKMESQCRIPDFREDWSSVASLGGALYCLFGISLNRFDCTFQNLTPKRLFGNFKNVNTRRYCKFQTSVFVRINLLHLLASFCKVRQTPWFSQNVKICEFQVSKNIHFPASFAYIYYLCAISASRLLTQ